MADALPPPPTEPDLRAKIAQLEAEAAARNLLEVEANFAKRRRPVLRTLDPASSDPFNRPYDGR